MITDHAGTRPSTLTSATHRITGSIYDARTNCTTHTQKYATRTAHTRTIKQPNKEGSNYDARTSLPDDDEKRPSCDGSNLGTRTKVPTTTKLLPPTGSNLDAPTEMTVCAHHEAPTYSVENENHNSSRDHTETIERRMIPTMMRSTAIL